MKQKDILLGNLSQNIILNLYNKTHRNYMKLNLRKQLKAELNRQGVSVPAMARKLGCNQSTLYDYFAGRKAMTADYLQALLNELGGRIVFKESAAWESTHIE